VCIGRDVGNSVTLAYPHALKGRRPKVASVEESRVGPAAIAVDHGFAIGIQTPRSPGEFKR
jgi:hypothetical protein